MLTKIDEQGRLLVKPFELLYVFIMLYNLKNICSEKTDYLQSNRKSTTKYTTCHTTNSIANNNSISM